MLRRQAPKSPGHCLPGFLHEGLLSAGLGDVSDLSPPRCWLQDWSPIPSRQHDPDTRGRSTTAATEPGPESRNRSTTAYSSPAFCARAVAHGGLLSTKKIDAILRTQLYPSHQHPTISPPILSALRQPRMTWRPAGWASFTEVHSGPINASQLKTDGVDLRRQIRPQDRQSRRIHLRYERLLLPTISGPSPSSSALIEPRCRRTLALARLQRGHLAERRLWRHG